MNVKQPTLSVCGRFLKMRYEDYDSDSLFFRRLLVNIALVLNLLKFTNFFTIFYPWFLISVRQ